MKTCRPLLVSILLSACATPAFKPSRPLHEAATINDALALCAEYQIHGEASVRVVTLVPWLDCLEDSFERFPNARQNIELREFYYALQSRYSSAPTSESTVIDSHGLNFAVRRALTHLADESLDEYTTQESTAFSKELPIYWAYLFNVGRVVTLQPERSPAQIREHALRREIEGPYPNEVESKPLKPRALPLNRDQRDYCKRYLDYRKLLYSVEELNEYRSRLDAATRADSSNTDEAALRERINARFLTLKSDAIARRKTLDGELEHLRKSSSWFQNGYCVNR